MELPLLGHHRKKPNLLLGSLYRARDSACSVWRTVTSPSYLTSRISRRQDWWWTWPLAWACATSVDVASWADGLTGFTWVAGDLLAATICSVLASKAPKTRLEVDLVLGTVSAGLILFQQLNASDDVRRSNAGFVAFVELVAVLAIMGLHSVGLCAILALACVDCILCSGTPDIEKLQGVQMLLMVFAGCVVMEICFAVLYAENETQLECNQRLLDFATDGFGSVDLEDHTLTHVSPKMAELLGGCEAPELIGSRLETLVEKADWQALDRFFGDAEAGHDPAPVLVTCHLKQVQFEARLVPYRTSGHQLGFCVQQVGEARDSGGAGAMELSRRCPSFPTPVLCCDAESRCGMQDIDSQSVAATTDPGSEISSSLISLSVSSGSTPATSTTLKAAPPSAAPRATKKVMRTVETQTPLTRKRLARPAPSAATIPLIPSNGQRTRSRRQTVEQLVYGSSNLPRARIDEGSRVLKQYTSTPRTTRRNGVGEMVRSFNINGVGCCSKHIAWADVHLLVSEEMNAACSELNHHRAWQCSECLALNPKEERDDDELSLQICFVCHEEQMADSEG